MSSKSPGLKRRQLIVQVLFLDDTVVPFQIEAKTTGFVLTNLVYQYLKLVESDYFGLEFIDPKGKKCWLDHDKAVSKQVPNNSMLIFCVKFYTPDPGQLEEEYTRYLFALQIKRDLSQGVLICTDATACLLASYILQAELGDYLDSYHSTPNYFADKKFFPHQTDEHDLKILDYHKNHIGQSPAEADLNLLDIARKTELYGVIMHPAKDHEGVQLNLAVASLGILVFQNFTKINTFSWAKIRKLSFKRKKFLIKLHPENYGFYKDTVEFYFGNRDDSKNFWKKCIENHSFFRCVRTERAPRPKSKWIVTRGSSFRYYGRTQKELIETAREQQIGKHRPFDRSYHSMRSISQFASNTDGQNGGGMTSAMSMNLVNGSNGNSQLTGNGTQSLNRNLASRSTGAIQMSNGLQSNNNNSTLSSNDDSSVNLQQHPSQNATHHLSYVTNSQQQQASPSVHHHHYNNNNNKSATLQSSQSYGGRTNGPMYHHHDDSGDYHDDPEHQMHNGADEYDNEEEEEEEEDDEEVDDPLSHQDPHHLAYKQRFSPQEPKGSRRYRQAMDDTSTHGSRTIDSRYSVNKGLGLSDEDDAENERDEDEDEEEDEEEEEGEPYDYDEEQHEQQMVSPPLVNDESSYGQQHSTRYGHEQKDYGQMSNGHQVVQDNGNCSTMHRCTCGQLHPVVEQQQQQVTSLNRPTSSQTRNRPAASSNYQNQESNQMDQYNQQISDSDGGISSSYSFRNPTRPKSGNLISLPIQQQQQSVQHQSNLRPSTLKKIDINTATSSDSHSLVPINPNKIISRKEVITTYKEETKNTLLEECYQTTTFYDSAATQPSTQPQQLLIQQATAAPPPPSKSLLTTKEDNIDNNKYGHLQTSQHQPDDIDNDDGKKNTSVKPLTLNSSSKSRNNSRNLTKSKLSSGSSSSNNNRTNNKSDLGSSSGGGEVGNISKSSMTCCNNSTPQSHSLITPPTLSSSSATLPKPARPSNPPILNPKSSTRRIHFSEKADLESPSATTSRLVVSNSGRVDNKSATLESQKRTNKTLNKTPIYVTSTQTNQNERPHSDKKQIVERVIKKKKANLPAKSALAMVQTSPPSDSNHLPALVTQCGPECEAISYSITSRSNSANSLSMVSFLHENSVINPKNIASKYAINNKLGPLVNSDKLDSLDDRYSFLASTSTSSESLVENPTLQSIKSMSNSSSSLSLSLHEGDENLNDGLNLEQLTKNLSRQLDKTERKICKMNENDAVVDNEKLKNSLPRMTKFVESVEIQRLSYLTSQDPDTLTPIVASTIQKHSSTLSPSEPYSTRQMFNTLDFLNGGTRVHTSGTAPNYHAKETKPSETEVARKPSLKKQTWIVEDTPERDKQQPSADKSGNKNKNDKKQASLEDKTESKLTTRILKLSESDENQIERLDTNPLLPPVAADLLLSANSPRSVSKEDLVVEAVGEVAAPSPLPVRDNDEDSLANMGSFSNIVDAVSEIKCELESNKAEESILFSNNTLEVPQDEEKIDDDDDDDEVGEITDYLPEPPSMLLVDEDEEDKQIQQLAASLVKDVIEKSTILTTVSTLTTITTTTTLSEEEEPNGQQEN